MGDDPWGIITKSTGEATLMSGLESSHPYPALTQRKRLRKSRMRQAVSYSVQDNDFFIFLILKRRKAMATTEMISDTRHNTGSTNRTNTF